MKSTIFVVLTCYFLVIDADPINNCSAASSCDACITGRTCAWCFDPRKISTPRCLDTSSHHTDTSGSACREDYLYFPTNFITKLKAKDFSYPPAHSASSSSSRNHKQSERNFITPEHVRATIRIGSKIRLRTFYVVNEHLPVDIYLVMDMRNPRENKNQQLNSLASSIVDAISNTTSDFRVGLGYISGSSQHITHHTSMAMDTSGLLHSVEQLVAGELPVSEGVPLGAIVETACSGNIGWGRQSQKIIIFVTDRDYEGHHSDNHGNTGVTSHICNRDFSSQSVQTVYQPSEISDLLNEKQIHVVFAVTDDVAPKYRELRDRLGHSDVTSLTTDTSDVGTLLENLYMNQSLDISLTDNSVNSLSVKYFTKCLTGVETETNKCHGVKVGERITYNILLELLSCPAHSTDWNQTLQIRPENLNGQLTMDLNFFCSCPSEMQGCSGNGRNVNGVCHCNDNYFGNNCECAGEKSSSSWCRANDTVSEDCSGSGTCVCGQCTCHAREDPQERIYGQYCEIDNFSCARGLEGMCSGRGTCIHGECVCYEGWEGEVCNSKKKTCKSSTITAECSGHGTCENNTCTCSETTEGRHYGEHCDKYELKNSPECNWYGRFVNGQCVCPENYFGRYCECYTSSGIMEDNCYKDNTTTVECSGRGSCICGQCECSIRIHPEENIYGKYCECDNFSCEYGNRLLCSGHGSCVCGECLCPEDWSGSSCSCSTRTDTCISPYGTNQEICSGHGACICGQCQCFKDEDGNNYTGKYCTTV